MPEEKPEKAKPAEATATQPGFFDEILAVMKEDSRKKAAERSKDKFIPGFEFKGGTGERWAILSADRAGDVYLLHDKSERGTPEKYKLPAEKAGRLKAVTVGSETYLLDMTEGQVYQKTATAGEFETRPSLRGMTREQINVERVMAEMTSSTGSDDGFKDTQAERTIGGARMAVQTYGQYDRVVTIDGKRVKFTSELGGWFSLDGGFRDKTNSLMTHCDTKVHVATLDVADLGRVQAALIPELMKAGSQGGALHGKIASFKTHDPMYAVNESWEGDLKPKGSGQGAKGFTIYATTPEAARDIQLYVDKFLKEKGLTLDPDKAKTGNVADKTLLPNGSNRVSFEKSHLEMAGNKGREAGLLTDVMEKAVVELAEKRVREKAKGWEAFSKAAELYEPGTSRFKPEVLHLLNSEFGMDGQSATLAYDDTRTYEKGRGRLALCAGHTSSKHSNGYYLDESKAEKTIERDGTGAVKKGLTGRAAYYEMGEVLKREFGYKENLAVFGDGDTPEREQPKTEVEAPKTEPQGRQRTSGRNRGPADRPAAAQDRGEVRSEGDTTFVVDKAPSAEVQKILDKWSSKEKTLERDLAKAIGKMPEGEQKKQMEDQLAKLVTMEEGATKDGIKRAMAELIVDARKPGFKWEAAAGRVLKVAGATGMAVAVGMLVQVLLSSEPGYAGVNRPSATPTFGG